MSYDGKYQDPDGMMVSKTPQYVFNRFSWVDEDKFITISDDFIVKLVKINEQKGWFRKRTVSFEQLNSYTMTNFDRGHMINKHFRYDGKDMSLTETTRRIMTKSEKYALMKHFS